LLQSPFSFSYFLVDQVPGPMVCFMNRFGMALLSVAELSIVEADGVLRINDVAVDCVDPSQEMQLGTQIDMVRLNSQWRNRFPVIAELASTSLAHKYFPDFLKRGYVIPVEATILVATKTIRTPSHVKSTIKDAFKPFIEVLPWTNPLLSRKIMDCIADTLHDEIENSVKEAENDRDWYEFFQRKDVSNRMQLSNTITESIEHHDSFMMMEGWAEVVRVKGGNIGSQDSVSFKVELKLRLLTLDTEKMKRANGSKKIRDDLDAYDPFA